MDTQTNQSSQFRRQLIAYFAENKNMLRSDVVIENEDHLIIFKEDAQANFYDIVVPASYILTGGAVLIDGKLKADLEIQLAVGNLQLGHIYPAGTELENIWRDMVSNVGVDLFNFATWQPVVEVGTTIIPNIFTWRQTGDVGEMSVTDTNGIIGIAQVPNALGWVEQYQYFDRTIIDWELNSANLGSVATLTTEWIFASFYGTSTDLSVGTQPPNVNPGDPTRIIADVQSSITVPLITANDEYGWIAVPAYNPTYTKWFITPLNQGNIGDGSDLNFIRYNGEFNINGVAYKLYAYNYPSEQTEPITLS